MATTAKVLRNLAFGLMMLFGVLGGAFVIGETFMDPGGVSAAVRSAAWVVPTIAFAAFALWRPRAATRVLTLVAVLLASLAVLDAVFDIVPVDELGPVLSIGAFGAAVALGCLGLHRPAPAGWLMLLLGAANLAGVFAKMWEADGAPLRAALGGSSGAVAVPVIAVGVLFLLAAAAEPRREGVRAAGGSQRPRAPAVH